MLPPDLAAILAIFLSKNHPRRKGYQRLGLAALTILANFATAASSAFMALAFAGATFFMVGIAGNKKNAPFFSSEVKRVILLGGFTCCFIYLVWTSFKQILRCLQLWWIKD